MYKLDSDPGDKRDIGHGSTPFMPRGNRSDHSTTRQTASNTMSPHRTARPDQAARTHPSPHHVNSGARYSPQHSSVNTCNRTVERNNSLRRDSSSHHSSNSMQERDDNSSNSSMRSREDNHSNNHLRGREDNHSNSSMRQRDDNTSRHEVLSQHMSPRHSRQVGNLRCT